LFFNKTSGKKPSNPLAFTAYGRFAICNIIVKAKAGKIGYNSNRKGCVLARFTVVLQNIWMVAPLTTKWYNLCRKMRFRSSATDVKVGSR
jgi:hypothetical protein